ncbi:MULTISPECIES: DUF397 domain-containing protein [unclassified Streptomyces]|uniref:DUF397 domain-containing protein n=1 Tax=unclassified Streptomyces TaxID=2593676 RepID=UPI002365DEAA|nr:MULTISPECIES: DUF397 domain-containing protein [unclassified Streptomyces]MDF3143017.1 DUF397 domain-containing protein [Streptomyces sp. T21Q-yed]WDF38542.1 DUF397 domain-containing protein [Streptomyces sp. T12]
MTTFLTWQKSSFSGGSTGDSCVELALPTASPTSIHLRESDTPTTVLTTTPTALHALLTTLKNGNGLPG